MADTPTEPRHVVEIGGRRFLHEAFQAAFNEQALAHIVSVVPQDATIRRAIRGVRSALTRGTHAKILGATLRRILETEDPVTDFEVEVVARFPAPTAE